LAAASLPAEWNTSRANEVLTTVNRPFDFDFMEHLQAVHLRQLPRLTTLLVWTRNSVYRVMVTNGCSIYVQGGAFFPEPTSAHLEGAGMGGSVVKAGWIGVGLVMEIHASGRRIVTSPVQAIVTKRAGTAVVH
jgi:hypothetical protein